MKTRKAKDMKQPKATELFVVVSVKIETQTTCSIECPYFSGVHIPPDGGWCKLFEDRMLADKKGRSRRTKKCLANVVVPMHELVKKSRKK